ncbi:MAG: hypothetical protein K0B15_11865 [Lentimicrobium sp.]|nr:hypothetical protein [Lentimicrobium sp.]
MKNSKTKKQKTNIEFVTDYMQWSSPLNQAFVIDAICKLANHICRDKDAVRESMKDSFVHAESWIKCAEDWQKDYNENYK